MPDISPKSRVALPDAPARLAGYVLDWGRLRLRDAAGAETKLTPKAGAVLAALLAARGRTVSRSELFDIAWPGSPSSDEVLTQVMQELRRAFADRQRVPAWLVTVPKLGYRWEGPAAEPLPADTESSPPPEQPARRSVAWRWAAAAAFAIAALGIAWLVARRPAERPAAPIARPLLREPARETEPHLSRDGRQLVYVRSDGLQSEIRLRVEGASERTLASSGEATLAAPRLARAGDRVAYTSRTARHCEVRVHALAGGEDRALPVACPYSLPTSIDWSADDAWIYLTLPASGTALAQRSLAVHRIRLADGMIERISDAGRWLSVDGHPRISDDGETLVFVRDGDGRHDVVTMPAGGGTETALTFPLWPYRVEWDGTALLLAAHGRSGLELWRGDRAGRLTAPLAREGAGPGITLAGDRVVFERHRADDNLWRLDLRDPHSTPVQLTQETGSEHSPRLSPDGKSVAYLSDASGDLEVHVRDFATGARRAWSALAPRVPLDLRWSPDGQSALLVIGGERGKRLALLQADGTLADLAPALRDVVPAQIEWERATGDWWIAAEREGRRELMRASAPDFERVELVLDRSVAAFALAAGETWIRAPGSARFESLAGTRTLPMPAIATPPEQWAVGDTHVVQAVQLGGSEPSRLEVTRLDGTPLRSLPLALPEPPLGRHFDLGGDTLIFARRDRVETDLYELTLPNR